MSPIKFCPKCSNVLKHLRYMGKLTLKCDNCGYTEEGSHLISSEKMEGKKQKIGITSGKNLYATFPHKCEKCGYDKAEVIDMGIKVSDEDPLILYKCGKCGHVEKELGKTG